LKTSFHQKTSLQTATGSSHPGAKHKHFAYVLFCLLYSAHEFK
jgi:hypothetical protein